MKERETQREFVLATQTNACLAEALAYIHHNMYRDYFNFNFPYAPKLVIQLDGFN